MDGGTTTITKTKQGHKIVLLKASKDKAVEKHDHSCPF